MQVLFPKEADVNRLNRADGHTPLSLAVTLSFTSEELQHKVVSALLQKGAKLTNNFLNVYGDTAWDLATPEMRKLLEEYGGQSSPAAEASNTPGLCVRPLRDICVWVVRV